MRRRPSILAVLVTILLAALAPPAAAQHLRPVPDSLTLAVGDTVRIRPVVTRSAAPLTPSYSSADAAIAGVSRTGLVTARAIGCTAVRVSAATYVRAAVPVCVVARATPAPTPTPTPTPAPQPGALHFSSDWSAGDLRDGGKWTTVYCQQAAQAAAVVAGAPVGWTRTSHVIRFTQGGPALCGMLERAQALPASTSHWGRFYFRNDDTVAAHNHVVTYQPMGDIQVAIWNRHGFRDGVRVFLRTYYRGDGSRASYPTHYWGPEAKLANGTWYRYEWHMEYVTPTSYRLWPRVYTMGDSLVFDASHYLQNDAPPGSGRTLAAWYAAGNTFGFSNVELARTIGLGNEGPGVPPTGQYWYHAAYALSLQGWVGR